MDCGLVSLWSLGIGDGETDLTTSPIIDGTIKALEPNKKNALDYSRPFDKHKDTHSKEIERLTIQIEADLRRLGQFQGQSQSTRRNLKSLLVNLYVHWSIDPKLYTGISFSSTTYKAKSRYNALGISNRIIAITKGLIKIGYLAHHRGFYNRDVPELSRNSRIRPKQKLTNHFKRIKKSEYVQITRPENEETIVLRGYDPATNTKPTIEYEDSKVPQAVPKMRAN